MEDVAPAPGEPLFDVSLACSPGDVSSFVAKPLVAPNRSQGACLDRDIAAIAEAVECKLTNGMPCPTLTQACSDCLFAAEGKGPFRLEDGRLTLNVGGCVALFSGFDEKDWYCARQFDSVEQCAAAACTSCFDRGAPAYNDCVDAARLGACASRRDMKECSYALFRAGFDPTNCLPSASLHESIVIYARTFCILVDPDAGGAPDAGANADAADAGG